MTRGGIERAAVRAAVEEGFHADRHADFTNRGVGRCIDANAAVARDVEVVFVEEAATERYRGVLGTSEDPIVSSDIIGDSRASIVDLTMTMVVDGDLVKVMSWYDNEWGFTCQMIREAFAALGLPGPDLSQIRP